MTFDKPVINAGIIGLGMGATMFVAHDLPDSTIRVNAVCDTNTELLDEVRDRYGVPFATMDWCELIGRSDIDVVGVFTPDALHADHVLAALDAGKHVICTKPMTTSLADAVRILDAVRRTGRTFLVGQTCRFDRNRRAAKALVDKGAYGRLVYVEATYNHDMRPVLDRTPWRWNMPQDLLFGGLCHPMDLAMWIGGRPREVSACESRESRLALSAGPRYKLCCEHSLREWRAWTSHRVIRLHSPRRDAVYRAHGERYASCQPRRAHYVGC